MFSALAERHRACERRRADVLGQSYALGNMLDQPVIDIINGPAARNVRAKILNGESDLPCKSCSAAQPLAPDAFAAYLTNLIEQYDAARGLVAAR